MSKTNITSIYADCFTLFLLSMFRLFSFIPLKYQPIIAKCLAWILKLLKRRYKITVANLQLAFKMDEKHACIIANQNFFYMGLYILDLANMAWGQHKNNTINEPTELLKMASFKNESYLDAALELSKKQNRAIILLGLHTTSIDLGYLLIGTKISYSHIYRPNDNKILDKFFYDLHYIKPNKILHEVKMISAFDPKAIIDVMRNKSILSILPDQRLRSGKSINIKFFDHEAKSNLLVHTLVDKYNPIILPVATYRDANLKCVTEFFPIMDLANKTKHEAMHKIFNHYETVITEHKSQYLWSHNRWDLDI